MFRLTGVCSAFSVSVDIVAAASNKSSTIKVFQVDREWGEMMKKSKVFIYRNPSYLEGKQTILFRTRRLGNVRLYIMARPRSTTFWSYCLPNGKEYTGTHRISKVFRTSVFEIFVFFSWRFSTKTSRNCLCNMQAINFFSWSCLDWQKASRLYKYPGIQIRSYMNPLNYKRSDIITGSHQRVTCIF